MSRHGPRRLHNRWGRVEEYELREVANALVPALAYRRDDGQIVVDVDETLRGQEREAAIETALLPFKEGRLIATPLALLATAGEAVARTAREYQRTAAAIASASVATAIGMATLTASGPLEPGDRPAVMASTPVQLVIAEPGQPTPRSTPKQAKHTPSPGTGDPVRGRPEGPQEAAKNVDPAPHPTRTRHRREPDPEPSVSSEPAKTHGAAEPAQQEAERDTREQVDLPIAPDLPVPTPKVEPPKLPTPDVELPEPLPQPGTASGCGGVGVNVDLGKLGGVNVCLGKGA